MYIEDGRLPEEQPGTPFDTPHGCRMTTDAVRMQDPSYTRPTQGERGLPEATPEEIAAAIKFGSAALAHATLMAQLSEGASMRARIEGVATAMTSPGFIDSLAASDLV